MKIRAGAALGSAFPTGRWGTIIFILCAFPWLATVCGATQSERSMAARWPTMAAIVQPIDRELKQTNLFVWTAEKEVCELVNLLLWRRWGIPAVWRYPWLKSATGSGAASRDWRPDLDRPSCHFPSDTQWQISSGDSPAPKHSGQREKRVWSCSFDSFDCNLDHSTVLYLIHWVQQWNFSIF